MLYILALRVFRYFEMIFPWIEILGPQPKEVFEELTMTQCTLCFIWDLVGSSSAINFFLVCYMLHNGLLCITWEYD